jgi:ABC-2 type transport system permease protein
MRNVVAVLAKEARELLTLQMLVPFVAVMVLFLFIGRVIRGERARSKQAQAVFVADQDGSELSAEIVAAFRDGNLDVVPVSGDRDEALRQARAAEASWVVLIPAGTGDSIAALRPAPVEVYNIIRGFSLTQTVRGISIKALLEQVNGRISERHLAQAYPRADPADLKSPLRPKEFVMVKEKLAEGNARMLEGLVLSQTFLIPIVLLMVIIYSSQMIAASMGQEKENKTLETLLTVPVSRVSIVIGKMLGAALVALVISAIFMVAMTYYVGSWTEEMPVPAGAGLSILSQLDIGLTLRSYVMVGIALFLAVLCALSLATLLAVFADDAKTAQMTITPLMMLVMVPYFFSMFFDVETASLPMRLMVYAIPFAYPFLTPKAVFFGNYGLVLVGYAYMAVFASVCIVIAARIFNTDRVLTAKLRLRRR